MKHVFYIVDCDEGSVKGTNDVDTAEYFVEDDRYVIIHAEGSYFCGSRKDNDIPTIKENHVDPNED